MTITQGKVSPINMRRRIAGSASGLAIAAALAVAAPVFSGAARAQGGDGAVLDTITVTAQFREQNLQQTPIAITAFNADMMEARSQNSIFEVSAQAPNVSLKPAGQAYGPSLGASIRGVGQFDFNPAYEPGVGMYVDDVYYATLTGSIFDLLDLDRVEILRGPQGTLAGKNSIGGAVKLYSRQPEGDGTGNAEVTYGSRDRLDLRASADFAITDNLFARISGVAKKQDGYVDRIDYGCAHPESGIPAVEAAQASGDCVVAREGEVDYNGARAMLRWDNGGPIEVNIIGDYTHDDRTVAAGVLTYANYTGTSDVNPFDNDVQMDSRFVPPDGSYYNYSSFVSFEDEGQSTQIADGRSYFEGWGVSGQVDWDLSDTLQLVSISAYRAYQSSFSNDNDMSPLAHSLGRSALDFWSFSQEVRLNGSFGENSAVEWTLGGFYMDQKSTYSTLQDLRYTPLPPFYGGALVPADTTAGFVNVNWHMTDKLTLGGGLRYTDETKDYTFSRFSPDGSPHPTLNVLNGQTGDYSADRIDYRVSAQYQWTDALMTYAQVATGFKGGGINPRPFFPSQVQPFGQEKLTSYELGFKGEFLDRLLRLNGALFYSDYKDIQLSASVCPDFTPTPTGAPCALPFNAGDAEMTGAELEAFLTLNGLQVDGSISYLDFEYQRVNPQAGDISMSNVAPYTPEWKWSLGAQYELDFANTGTLTPRFDISYQDDVFTDSSNEPQGRIDSYYLANARLIWRSADQDWEAALAVTNIFDKYHFLTKFEQVSSTGLASGQPGRPREWAVTVRRYF